MIIIGVTLTSAAIAALVKVWNLETKEEKRQTLIPAVSLLLSDDEQHVPTEKRLPITQTTSNIVSMRLRGNSQEINSYATLLERRGYTRTASALKKAAQRI